jgi:hypothetical protein
LNPCAGKITNKGVLAPMTPEIYKPIMELLELENLTMYEETL